ncbi:MAG: leucyl/phenylalanyl-tRNA--protein transferase [Robiginitomaculum sp.]|nr:leucyl/phenylalanyl-tRNA--protein transferase [Robiginitomaculum sp.]
MTFGVPELLALYAKGQFPMAENQTSYSVAIIDPEMRGILPLSALHLPRRLARTINSERFHVTINNNFAAVIAMCAEPAVDRQQTWINPGIDYLCQELHQLGHAHSVECYLDNKLVGGLYGVTLGGAFFGESMFTRSRDASKVALFHLCARLIKQGFCLLDTQFITEHLEQFGAIEITRDDYLQLLQTAKQQSPTFCSANKTMSGQQVLQILKNK